MILEQFEEKIIYPRHFLKPVEDDFIEILHKAVLFEIFRAVKLGSSCKFSKVSFLASLG